MQEYQIILKIKTKKQGIKGKVFTAALYLLPKERKKEKGVERERERKWREIILLSNSKKKKKFKL